MEKLESARKSVVPEAKAGDCSKMVAAVRGDK